MIVLCFNLVFIYLFFSLFSYFYFILSFILFDGPKAHLGPLGGPIANPFLQARESRLDLLLTHAWLPCTKRDHLQKLADCLKAHARFTPRPCMSLRQPTPESMQVFFLFLAQLLPSSPTHHHKSLWASSMWVQNRLDVLHKFLSFGSSPHMLCPPADHIHTQDMPYKRWTPSLFHL